VKIGYARVSSDQQSLESQIEFLNKVGCEKIYMDQVSGKSSSNRDQLNEMINFVREGDIVHVTKVDRIARNTVDALKIADKFQIKDVGIIFHDLGEIDINSDVGRVIYTTISAFAEMERKRILDRCNEGRAIAKAKGKHLGRFKDEKPHAQIKEYFTKGMNKNLISKTLKCSRTTVYRVLAN
jgi:DNA invertase Pin-like site-specific DNA recombinase